MFSISIDVYVESGIVRSASHLVVPIHVLFNISYDLNKMTSESPYHPSVNDLQALPFERTKCQLLSFLISATFLYLGVTYIKQDQRLYLNQDDTNYAT